MKKQIFLDGMESFEVSEGGPTYIPDELKTKIDAFWEEFLETHPRATRGPKVSLDALTHGKDAKLLVSRGLTYADVSFTKKVEGPEHPMDSYLPEKGDTLRRDPRYSNALSTGMILLLDEKGDSNLSDIKVPFLVRGSGNADQVGTVSIVNGYVDPTDGLPIDTDYITAEALREMTEETRGAITPDQVKGVTPLGLAQMRGSADLILAGRVPMSGDDFYEKWKTGSDEGNETSEMYLFPATELSRVSEYGNLNSLILSMNHILTPNRIESWLDRMRG